jgi:acetoin utilization protein AcuB
MRAEQAMTRNVVCVKPDDTAAEALEIMQEWSIRHLPVVENDQLVGILSDRDLVRIDLDAAVSEYMTEEPITCSTTTSLAAAAETMLAEKIDCLPVLDNDEDLAGLITVSDFLELVIEREQMMLSRPIPFSFHLFRSVRPGMKSSLVGSAS